MCWLHTHVNRSGDVVTASSCILGREMEGDVFSTSAATALKMFPLPLPSSICTAVLRQG